LETNFPRKRVAFRPMDTSRAAPQPEHAAPGALPDWLGPDLDIVWIDVNPSLPAARAGYPFANPRNRFWPALNASRLPQAPLEPSAAAMDVLLARDRLGCTDLVKRPSRGQADLTAAERRAGAARLAGLLDRCRPRILWFQGRTPFEHYCRHALGEKPPAGVRKLGSDQTFSLFTRPLARTLGRKSDLTPISPDRLRPAGRRAVRRALLRHPQPEPGGPRPLRVARRRVRGAGWRVADLRTAV